MIPMEIERQPCGHPVACIMGDDEGTNYCGWCVDADAHYWKGVRDALKQVAHGLSAIPVRLALWRIEDEGEGISDD